MLVMPDKTTLFVVYLDEYGQMRDALITNDFNKEHDGLVNLIFVSNDENKTDNYGRQLERRTSVAYVKDGYEDLLANCWMYYADWHHIYATKKSSSRFHVNPQ